MGGSRVKKQVPAVTRRKSASSRRDERTPAVCVAFAGHVSRSSMQIPKRGRGGWITVDISLAIKGVFDAAAVADVLVSSAPIVVTLSRTDLN